MTELLLGPDADGRWVRVRGDRIADGGEGPAPSHAGESLSCADARVHFAEVNAHTHIYSALVPLGMPEPSVPPENFVQILERIWWRLDRALDAESLRASARLYAAEALLSGTTVLIDHHESPGFIEGSLDPIADACDEIGIRSVLCYGATERNDGRDEGRRGLEECRRFLRENRRPDVRGLIGLHASFTVSDATIEDAARLCREHDTVLHVHLAEDGADVEDARRRGDDGPLERLLRLDALPPGSICAHGVHLSPDQVRSHGDSGGWIVQNPRSNRGNRVGYPRLAAHPRVALGTDGYPANLIEEEEVLREEAERHGEEIEATRARRPRGRDLAAERFGLPFAAADSGAPWQATARGAMADLVVRRGREVRHVVVGGRVRVRDGELLTADIEPIRGEARAQAERLWDRMRAVPE